MKVDLSRVQQASALASDDSDDSDREIPPDWNAREEPFDDYYEHAQAYLNRSGQERAPRPPSSIPSPFLRPHERAAVNGSTSHGNGGFHDSREQVLDPLLRGFRTF
jgi:hypothetical protein